MFYKQKFHKFFSDLGGVRYAQNFSDAELLAIMQKSKAQRSTPQEAAARAYRHLILNNSFIPAEERLSDSFNVLDVTIRWWLAEGKLNADLLENLLAIRDQLLRDFVGEQYENSYYHYLSDIGLIIPIKHYMLGCGAKINLLMQNIAGAGPAYAAIILLVSQKWKEYENSTVSIFRHQTEDNLDTLNIALNLSARMIRKLIDEDFSAPGAHFSSPKERLLVMTNAQSFLNSTPTSYCESKKEHDHLSREDGKSIIAADANTAKDSDTGNVNIEELDLPSRSLLSNDEYFMTSMRNALALLKLQKNMIQGNHKSMPTEAIDGFSLGYITGLCASVFIAVNEVADSRKMEIHLRCVLSFLFGNTEVEKFIVAIEDRLRLQDQEFRKGWETGKEELNTFLKHKAEGRGLVSPPMDWFFHFRKNT